MISNRGLGSERMYVSSALFVVADENRVSVGFVRPNKLFFASVNFANNEDEAFEVGALVVGSLESSGTAKDCMDDECADCLWRTKERNGLEFAKCY